MKRFEYKFTKEVARLEAKGKYQEYCPKKVAEAAEECGIYKFALFFGYGYWLKEIHDVIRIEFSCNTQMTNEVIKTFKDALDKVFDYGQNTVFVVYTEVDH